jgi:Rrf2 family protein
MIHFATLPTKERVLLPALAKATGTPQSFLSKVLQSLTKAGLIASRRGQAGGFELLDRGRKASMRKVIEAIDGTIYLNVCLMSGKSCRRKTWCPAHPAWRNAQEAMMGVLDTTMIADLAAEAVRATPQPIAANPEPDASLEGASASLKVAAKKKSKRPAGVAKAK